MMAVVREFDILVVFVGKQFKHVCNTTLAHVDEFSFVEVNQFVS